MDPGRYRCSYLRLYKDIHLSYVRRRSKESDNEPGAETGEAVKAECETVLDFVAVVIARPSSTCAGKGYGKHKSFLELREH